MKFTFVLLAIDLSLTKGNENVPTCRVTSRINMSPFYVNCLAQSLASSKAHRIEASAILLLSIKISVALITICIVDSNRLIQTLRELHYLPECNILAPHCNFVSKYIKFWYLFFSIFQLNYS